MAATRGEFPDFNLLATFCLEEFGKEKDAMNAQKNEASDEQGNKKKDLWRWESTTSTISSQIRRLNKLKKHFLQSFLHVGWNSLFSSALQKSLIRTKDGKRGVERYY